MNYDTSTTTGASTNNRDAIETSDAMSSSVSVRAVRPEQSGREFRIEPSDKRWTSMHDSDEQPSRAATARRVDSKVRHQSHAYFDSCLDDLSRLCDAAEDIILRDNAFSQLKKSLNGLWALRNRREPAFAELINSLQMLFPERGPSDLTKCQFKTLESVLRQMRDVNDFDDDFVNRLTIELLRGGLDVFRETD